MESERTLINLRGYCFYCLKKIGNEGDNSYYKSPACTPVPPSPLSTPLRTRCHNVHNLPAEERLAPFTDLCRYLGVEVPDCYAFGDGADPEVMYPPLCDKCHELSARLCILQDELQYIQTRIRNTVDRIHRRVASTCDTRGALKREEFNKDFRRKSKGSLSRGRGENTEMKKVTELLKVFQMKIMEKDHESREKRKRRATNVLFPYGRSSVAPEVQPFVSNDAGVNDTNIANFNDTNLAIVNDTNIANVNDAKEPEHNDVENEENMQPESENEELFLSAQDYLPPEETLRCSRPVNGRVNVRQDLDVQVKVRREIENPKPYPPDLSTILCSHHEHSSHLHNSRSETTGSDDEDDYHLKTTLILGGVTTRSKAKVLQNTLDLPQNPVKNDKHILRRRARKITKS